jgi:hypothetical protein
MVLCSYKTSSVVSIMLNVQDMVTQIIGYYNLSTKYERQEGELWYPDAWKTCKDLAKLYNVPKHHVAGIVAALSPRNKWSRNVIDAEAVLAHGEHATVSTFRLNKDKALRILNDDDPMNVLSGNKVRSFYLSIIGFTSEPCIDGHAYAVACGNGERLKVKRISDTDYADVQRAYLLAADSIGISASTLQATTWLTYRRVHKIS